jgi:hypothetical protein
VLLLHVLRREEMSVRPAALLGRRVPGASVTTRLSTSRAPPVSRWGGGASRGSIACARRRDDEEDDNEEDDWGRPVGRHKGAKKQVRRCFH